MSEIHDGLPTRQQTPQLTSSTFSPDVIKAAQDILAAAGMVQTVSTTGAIIPPKSAQEHLHEVSQAVIASGIGDTTQIKGETTLEELHTRVINMELKLGQIIRRYFRSEDFSEPTTP